MSELRAASAPGAESGEMVDTSGGRRGRGGLGHRRASPHAGQTRKPRLFSLQGPEPTAARPLLPSGPCLSNMSLIACRRGDMQKQAWWSSGQAGAPLLRSARPGPPADGGVRRRAEVSQLPRPGLSRGLRTPGCCPLGCHFPFPLHPWDPGPPPQTPEWPRAPAQTPPQA